jgi:elongation factor G
MEFKGVINLVEKKYLAYKNDLSGAFTIEETPDEMNEKVEQFRGKLMEDIAESSDELLEKYLEGSKLTNEQMYTALKQGVISGKLFPILLGSALRNIGMQPLLDFMVECFPSPIERGELSGLQKG